MDFFHLSFWGFQGPQSASNGAVNPAPRSRRGSEILRPLPQPIGYRPAENRAARAQAAAEAHARGCTCPEHNLASAVDVTETARGLSNEAQAILLRLDRDMERDNDAHLRTVNQFLARQNRRILEILEAALIERQDAAMDRLRRSQNEARRVAVEEIRRVLPPVPAHQHGSRVASVSTDEEDLRGYRRQAQAARVEVNARGTRRAIEEVQRGDREGSVYRQMAEEVARDVAQTIGAIGRRAYEVCALLIRYPRQV